MRSLLPSPRRSHNLTGARSGDGSAAFYRVGLDLSEGLLVEEDGIVRTEEDLAHSARAEKAQEGRVPVPGRMGRRPDEMVLELPPLEDLAELGLLR